MKEDRAPFDADRLRRALGSALGAFSIRVVDRTGSTNDDLRELAAAGAPSGTVLVADAQTAGKGRRGRSWTSLPGAGLYLSVLFRAERPPAELPRWTLAAAVAVRETCVALAAIPVSIKWPNDLVCRGRKLAGILAEGRFTPAGVEIVLGIGINVAHRPEDFPEPLRALATSIEIESGSPAPTRERLAADLLPRLEAVHRSLAAGEWEPIRVRWERAATPFSGRAVEIESGSGARFRGRVRGIGEHGSLEIDRADGARVAVVASEAVRWLEE